MCKWEHTVQVGTHCAGGNKLCADVKCLYSTHENKLCADENKLFVEENKLFVLV